MGGAVSAALLANSGCSLFVPQKQAVHITASDPLAAIMVDGEFVGTGSAAVQLQRNRSHTVVAQVGARQGAGVINTRISTAGVLDIVGGFIFLVPFLGLLGPGFWDLTPEELSVIVPGETAAQATGKAQPATRNIDKAMEKMWPNWRTGE